MAYDREEKNYLKTACYPQAQRGPRRLIGAVLIAAGVVLILFSVPYWAWWALLGAVLIGVGLILAGSG